MKFLLLDTETTGFKDPRLVQVAWHVYGEVSYTLGTYRPGKMIEEGATKVHGIYNADVQDYPLFAETNDYTKLRQLLTDHILVCHNTVYDLRVLLNEGLRVEKSLCTKELSKHFFPGEPSYSLGNLKKSRQLKMLNIFPAHTAISDTIALRALFHLLKTTATLKAGPDALKSFIKTYP